MKKTTEMVAVLVQEMMWQEESTARLALGRRRRVETNTR